MAIPAGTQIGPYEGIASLGTGGMGEIYRAGDLRALTRRNSREIQRTYEHLAAVCHAHGIAQESRWAAPLCGRALIDLGETNRGRRVLEESLAAHTITRSALLRPYRFCLIAGALHRANEFARVQRALYDARAVGGCDPKAGGVLTPVPARVREAVHTPDYVPAEAPLRTLDSR